MTKTITHVGQFICDMHGRGLNWQPAELAENYEIRNPITFYFNEADSESVEPGRLFLS